MCQRRKRGPPARECRSLRGVGTKMWGFRSRVQVYTGVQACCSSCGVESLESRACNPNKGPQDMGVVGPAYWPLCTVETVVVLHGLTGIMREGCTNPRIPMRSRVERLSCCKWGKMCSTAGVLDRKAIPLKCR